MLFGLRHPAVVRRDHEQREIDRPDAGDHVPHEIFVPRHIDHAEREARQSEMRKAEIDRDPARFFLRQPVGVGAGERLDQRRLAVIDMSGGGEDERSRRQVLEWVSNR